MENNQSRESYHNKAIASMVLGIIGVVCIFFGYSVFVGIAVSIVGLILGIQVQKEAPEGMAKAGVILSVVALGLCALVLVACIACAGMLGIAGWMSL